MNWYAEKAQVDVQRTSVNLFSVWGEKGVEIELNNKLVTLLQSAWKTIENMIPSDYAKTIIAYL